MMASAETISAFVHKHPTVKMLALSFLLLIGMSLILEGFDHHIPKGYIYFAMGFSVFVEMINLRLRKATKPVHLHERYTEHPPPADPERQSLEGPLMSYLMLVVTIVAQAAAAVPPAAGYVPQRVYDTRRGAFTDFESMVADLARADVVFVGEQHDDGRTHRLEEALLGGLRRRKVAPTVSLEMFERDVQGVVDGYLAGSIGEPQFLQESRPWPRVRDRLPPARRDGEDARAGRSSRPTCRAGSPRPSRSRGAGDRTTAAADRALVAAQLECPHDAYFARFTEAMTDHSPPENKASEPDLRRRPAEQRATTDRYYWSQCAKDETMAESVARAVTDRAGKPGPVVHFTGAFHTDFGAGTAERTRRRLPGRRVAVVSIAAGRGSRRRRSGRRRSEAGGLSGLYAEIASGLRGSGFGKAGGTQRQQRARIYRLVASEYHRLPPEPRTPAPNPDSSEPLRHIRHHIRHHRDRRRGGRHVVRVDLVDGVGLRMVNRGSSFRRRRVRAQGCRRPGRSDRCPRRRRPR